MGIPLIDSIISAESGGDPNAKNPNSSATGAGQFISATWIDTLSKARPDLVQGKSRDEILALRNDPQLSREMTESYANQNGAILSKAGHETSPGNTYLAHFAGPQGAVSVLSADPSTPVSAILMPDAIKSNPFLKDMTAGDLKAWASKKMGGTATPAAQPAPASPTGLLNAIPQANATPPIFAAAPAQSQAQPQSPQSPQGPMQSDAPEIAPMRQQQSPIASFLAQLQSQQQIAPVLSQLKRRQLASSRTPIF